MVSLRREVDLRLVVQDELVALDAVAQVAEQREAAGRAPPPARPRTARSRCPIAWRRTSPGRRGAADRRRCRRGPGRARCRCSRARRWRGRRRRTAARAPAGSSRRRSPRRPGRCLRAAGSRTRPRRAAPPCPPSRRQPTRRSATSFRSASPCWWPSVSLTCLNSSRSRTSSASDSPVLQRRADRVVDAVPEQHAVGEVGEVVVQRLVLERLGVGLALGDVAQAGDVDRAGRPAARRSGRAPSGTSSRPCGGPPTRPSGRACSCGLRVCRSASA